VVVSETLIQETE